MKNKYISKNLRNRFSKSTAKIKSVLFLFLGIVISVNVNAEVVIATSPTSSVIANDGQAIAAGMSGMITINSSTCPPSFSYTTVDATDAFTNDGEITVTIDPLAVGPFDYYLFDISGSIIQGPFFSQVSNVYTFLNLSSGYYEVAVNNQECSSSGFNSIDSINIYSIAN